MSSERTERILEKYWGVCESTCCQFQCATDLLGGGRGARRDVRMHTEAIALVGVDVALTF